MKQVLPNWRIDNKWPIFLWVISMIFTLGFIYSQFRTVLENQERDHRLIINFDKRVKIGELNTHSLFTYHPNLIELFYQE